jgi:mRNA interferase RelE/StbE
MYQVTLLPAAVRDLADLDKAVAARIVRRIQWLAENLDNMAPEALTAQFAGFYKLRVGAYRVIYAIDREDRLIIVHTIRHRREVYRQR